MRFTVDASDGRSIEVEAVDWMMAMVRATEALGTQAAGFDCERRPGGQVHVTDHETGAHWTVTPVDGEPGAPADPVMRVPTPIGSTPRGAVPPRPRRYNSPLRKPMWSPDSTPRKGPAPSDPRLGRPPNLAERLFELSSAITSEPTAEAAASRSLEVALALVPCEAASVLRGGRHDQALVFFAVSGGAGDTLLGRSVPFGEGIAGATYDAGVSIVVHDVAGDPRHMASFDAETGFSSRAILCVPVRSEAGFHGVVELLNPPEGREFLAWHVDVVESLSAALAQAFSSP